MKKWFKFKDGLHVPIEEVMEGSAKFPYDYPMSYLKRAAEDDPWNGKPRVTELCGCLREAYLKKVKDYIVDLEKESAKLIGSDVHSKLESGLFSEIKVDSEFVRGTADLLDFHEGEIYLVDYKVLGSFAIRKLLGLVSYDVAWLDDYGNPMKYKSGKNAGQPKTRKEWTIDASKVDNKHYTRQLNIYAMILEKTIESSLLVVPIKKPITRLKIFVMVKEPPHVSAQNGITERTYMVDIPKIPKERVIEFVQARSEILMKAHADGVVPDVGSDNEVWNGDKCRGFCEVSNYCKDLGNPHLEV